MAYNKDQLLKEKYAHLSLKNVFGVRTDINDNVNYFSSDKCAYVTGNYIAICSIKEKTQNFISTNPNYGEITCFSIDEKGDLILLAIAQKGEKNIITLKFLNKDDIGNEKSIREIKLAPDDLEYGDYFISISVNLTKFYITAYFGTKVSGVVMYYYDPKNAQAKIIAGEKITSKYNYKQIKINPYDPNYFAVIGEGAITVFKYNENDKKLNRMEITQSTYQEFNHKEFIFNFVTFTWVSQTRLAIINYSCDVLIIDYYKKFDSPIKKLIKSEEIFDTKSRAKSIFAKFNNIYIVKDDGYTIKLESKNAESKQQISYDKIQGPKFIQNLPRMEVHTVSVNNPSNAVGNTAGILFSTESGQIFHIDISNDTSLFEGSNFKYLIAPFHSEEIVALDVAKIKTLVVTASKDRYIRVWNYISIQLEASESFEEEPTHVAIHPNGLHLATLFRSKCRLMNICEKSIRVYKEINIDQPFDVKFSTYGHYFSICYSMKFIIYDFYSMDVKFKSLESPHKGEVMSLVWDTNNGISDFNFATCSLDGRAFYWDINNNEHALYEYVNRDKKFLGVNFYKVVDTSNNNQEHFYFLLIDENSLFEVEAFPVIKEGGKIIHSKEIEGKRELKPVKTLIKEDYITQFSFDAETKTVLTANTREHSPTMRIFRQNTLDPKEMVLYQANSTGVKQFKVSYDLTYLFTCGRDKCLMIFQINNVSKQDKREESPETDLILVEKSELDQEKDNLVKKLTLIQNEIVREEERAIKEQRELDLEINNNSSFLQVEENKYYLEKNKLEHAIAEKEEEHFKEESEKLEIHEEKIRLLKIDQENSKHLKENEEKKENENIDKTMKYHSTQEINQLKQYRLENTKLEQEYEAKILEINLKIKEREAEKEKLNKELTDEKDKYMSENDDNIAKKRYELEKLRIEYDRVEREFARIKNEMNNEILKKKKEVKNKEETKNTEKNDLIEMQNTNDKIAKEIRELSAERKDKEQTIIEKNTIERELFKENQELEKFKFVLNYKIKELQHEKDPKENKLQQLEKQAKDMDREIKNFEFAQRNYLIELTTNNEIMNLHEKQIIQCEKNIEKLKYYKKLFKQALYQASLKASSYKHLKKRIVELKKWFLDKDYIDQLEKTSDDSDYETQREFLEENNKNNKEKIRSTQKLFGQDHQKLMRENMNLIRIVNELEREQHEIKLKNFNNADDHDYILKGKSKSKIMVPIFSQGSSSLSQKEKDLKKELQETEKEIVFLNLKKKKMRREKDEKEKIRKKEEMKARYGY